MAIPGKREPRVIGDYRRNARARLVNREEVVAEEEARYARAAGDPELPKVVAERKVLEPYFPREPIPAGDPMSPGGALVTYDELDASLQEQIDQGGGGTITVREQDGTPTLTDIDTLVVNDGDLTAGPGAGEASIDTGGGGGIVVEIREVILEFSAAVPAGTAFNIQTGAYVGPGSPATVIADTNVTLPASGALFADDGRIEVHLNGQELEKGPVLGSAEADWVSPTQIALAVRVLPGNQIRVRAPFPVAT